MTATLNGAPLSNDVVLTVSVEGDSAEESTDFEAVTDFEVTIEGGSSAGSQVFALTPISDQRYEGDETLLVSATTRASLAVGPSPGLVLKMANSTGARSTSANRAHRGNAPPTNKPTDCYDAGYPKAPTSTSTPHTSRSSNTRQPQHHAPQTTQLEISQNHLYSTDLQPPLEFAHVRSDYV